MKRGIKMGYKLNGGDHAYLCDECGVVIATREFAQHLAKVEDDKYCKVCKDRRADDPNTFVEVLIAVVVLIGTIGIITTAAYLRR